MCLRRTSDNTHSSRTATRTYRWAAVPPQPAPPPPDGTTRSERAEPPDSTPGGTLEENTMVLIHFFIYLLHYNNLLLVFFDVVSDSVIRSRFVYVLLDGNRNGDYLDSNQVCVQIRTKCQDKMLDNLFGSNS